jgi:hypothetical protein
LAEDSKRHQETPKIIFLKMKEKMRKGFVGEAAHGKNKSWAA